MSDSEVSVAAVASREDIESCYKLLLDRVPLSSEVDNWVALSQSEHLTASQVATRFLTSPEFGMRGPARIPGTRRPVHTYEINGLCFALGSGDMVYGGSEYEMHVFRPLFQRLQPGMTFLDIGAN